MRETGESGYGLYVIVDHADGFATLYAHCSSISAKVGDTVTCGEQIAKVGQTGNATGPHLHLELWHNGAALDPADYLRCEPNQVLTAFLCSWLRSGARIRAACSPFSCWRRLYMSADTFSSFVCPAARCTPCA
mgnify:CR=1 FL=1